MPMDFQSNQEIYIFINDVIHGMTFSETLKKRWYVLIAILGIIILLICFGFITMIGNVPSATIFVYELNGRVAPQGNSISLTENDFNAFPKLAPVIRDMTKKPVEITSDGRLLYKIPLYGDERSVFVPLYGSSGFFEYEGKYYSFDVVLI